MVYLWGKDLIMKSVSLKIEDAIFGETEKILSKLKKPRNRYINEAIKHYNQVQKRMLLEDKLKYESSIVGDESIGVLREFECADNADQEI